MSDLISVQELAYRYPDGTNALKGVNLSLHDSERLGLIGANGAGKSTLLLHLNGLLLGDGDISVAGTPITKSTLEEVRRKVGFVFQNPDDQLFLPTVAENIAFGLKDPAMHDEVVNQVLDIVGLKGANDRNAWHLSFGEKRRASLATVLAMNVKVLVLDEPSAGLDPRGRRELIELLKSLDLPMIIATHDLAMVRDLCSRVVVLHDGQDIAEGPTAEILDNEEQLHNFGLA